MIEDLPIGDQIGTQRNVDDWCNPSKQSQHMSIDIYTGLNFVRQTKKTQLIGEIGVIDDERAKASNRHLFETTQYWIRCRRAASMTSNQRLVKLKHNKLFFLTQSNRVVRQCDRAPFASLVRIQNSSFDIDIMSNFQFAPITNKKTIALIDQDTKNVNEN